MKDSKASLKMEYLFKANIFIAMEIYLKDSCYMENFPLKEK